MTATREDADAAARGAAIRAARTSYGRLVGVLAAPSGDIALAEDALQDAFERALATWPSAGVPHSPEAWLLTVARNRQRDAWKSPAHASVPIDVAPPVADPLVGADPDAIGDKRLELLFACAHPAIDERIRAPLMLQATLGFEAADIARAFALPPATMAQRLVRAKRRIRDAGVPFAIPDRSHMAARLPHVLEAVYGCAAMSWRGDRLSLAGEAAHLARTLAELLPGEPEVHALAALVTLSLARRATAPGFTPLDEQDPSDWDARLADEGDDHLRRAQHARRRTEHAPGRFELEAAIHSAHAVRRFGADVDLAAVLELYDALLVVAPTSGAQVARAAVVGRLESPEAGLEALGDEQAFQPWWAVRAELLSRLGRIEQAAEAYWRAAELTTDPAVRDHLRAMLTSARGDVPDPRR